jgi:geranylgeranyl pyrophosphate synthase
VAHRRRRLRNLLDPDILGVDLVDVARQLDGALSDLAGGEGAPPGFDPRHFLAPGVPRIRPLLVLLSARAAGTEHTGDGPHPFPNTATEHLAVAAELLHVAIAMHDAALGRPGGRRRRAARRIISRAVGLLGGNHLTLRALELVRTSDTPEIVGDLLEAMREISDGHSLDQRLQGRMATAAEVLAVAESHSGAVFGFACRAGAKVAGAERTVVTALGRYGRHTGVAWHLAEDLAMLDLDGEDAAAAVEERAADGRPSHTVAVAAERDPDLAAAWARLATTPDLHAAADIAHRLKSTGAWGVTRQTLAQEAWAARRSLAPLRPSRHKEALDRLAAGLTRLAPETLAQYPLGQAQYPLGQE